MRIRSKVWLDRDGELGFGSGRAEILRAVEKAGSLNKAATMLGMSYRHAWSSIRSAEERLGQRLLVRHKGGPRGGGADLTEYARDLLARFEALDRDVRAYTDKRYKVLFQKKRGPTGKRRTKD